MMISRINISIWHWRRPATMVLLLISFNFFSCQEKIEWELSMSNDVRLVVEGKITNEQRAHLVRLSVPVYEINGRPEPVSGANVVISDGDTIFQLTEDPEQPGSYYTDPDVRGVVNRTYRLGIEVGDYQFAGIASMKGSHPSGHLLFRKYRMILHCTKCVFLAMTNPPG